MDPYEELIKLLIPCCYKTNNRYAYFYDLTGEHVLKEGKYINFVPSYDNWCLHCEKKDCKLKCSKCKLIYYCSKECQKKSHNIHKRHCSRDLFTICITCGSSNCRIKCAKCPVKFCSQECFDVIIKPHLEIECPIFSKTFGTGSEIKTPE
jgi:hypothetical protein